MNNRWSKENELLPKVRGNPPGAALDAEIDGIVVYSITLYGRRM